MEVWILAFLILFSVLLILLFRFCRNQKTKMSVQSDGNTLRIAYENGQAVAIYICEPGVTETKGKVWKCTAAGWEYSECGLGGPYIRALSSDFKISC